LGQEKLTNQEQRKVDWAIMKEMARYLWPKVLVLGNWINVRQLTSWQDSLGTKVRVGLSLGLLVGAKVIHIAVLRWLKADLLYRQVLNVQVPFYFKSIVDSMNVDFIALGGTAYTVAGSMILACRSELGMVLSRVLIDLPI
jgi:ABC transporter ATM